MLLIKRTFSLARKSCSQFTRAISSQYKQGQSFKNERGKSIREYFYYIDHHGQVDSTNKIYITLINIIFNSIQSYFWTIQRLKTLHHASKNNTFLNFTSEI